jgi:UDP-N-acetylmuramate: L-alanyl-gamma-D-glutamyl-meso-diaminopimelate ligase
MIMHLLKKYNFDFDYAVGSSIAGFENSVQLSDAPVIIIEGDEYLSSPVDTRPKFMWYHPQIALINGIAWDHINVFPTYEIYKEQFGNFIKSMDKGSILIYYADDQQTAALVNHNGSHLQKIPVQLPEYEIKDGLTITKIEGSTYPLSVFGKHNLQNLSGAQKICAALGIKAGDFWKAAGNFKGAGKRLEKINNTQGIIAFRDFAHAPSKVQATVHAVKNQFPDKKLVAILELHTFSSLNRNFINEYASTMKDADVAIVYVDNHALVAKGGDIYTEEQIRHAFQKNDTRFFDSKDELEQAVKQYISEDNTLLFMSSGNFGGMKLEGMINNQ